MTAPKNVMKGGVGSFNKNIISFLIDFEQNVPLIFVFMVIATILIIYIAIKLGSVIYKSANDSYLKYRLGDEMLLKKTDQ